MLALERLSVNTLAQWHAQARFQQDALRVSLAQVLGELTNLAEVHRSELGALDCHLHSHLGERNDALDLWLRKVYNRQAKRLGFDSLVRNAREMRRLKRKTMARHILAGWRQVGLSLTSLLDPMRLRCTGEGCQLTSLLLLAVCMRMPSPPST